MPKTARAPAYAIVPLSVQVPLTKDHLWMVPAVSSATYSTLLPASDAKKKPSGLVPAPGRVSGVTVWPAVVGRPVPIVFTALPLTAP